MSDEAHFHLIGYVQNQNYSYWVDTNPTEVHERPSHVSKVTIWCALLLHGIIAPYFFESEQKISITVTANRYV